MRKTYDVLIVGGGIVGLCVANQLQVKGITSNIAVLDKEFALGLHSSGRNSGVLHSGLYYKPGSLKAKVSVEGARRLREWVEERGLPINACGKVIVPQKIELDSQLDLLLNRAKSNSVEVELWDEQQLKELIPQARTSSGRAIWVPSTSVVKPITIIRRLQEELELKGIKILKERNCLNFDSDKRKLYFSEGDYLSYGHLINCAGLQADRVAHCFDVGRNYSLIPFKGLYWDLKRECDLKPVANLYPVPDLNMPFLGIHFTPSADSRPVVSIGPTATPALGRENYRGFQKFEPVLTAANLTLLARQYLLNRGGFRRYVNEQSLMVMQPFLLRAAQELIPNVRIDHIELSKKVGIRSQLFNHNTQSLEDDFLCLPGPSSTHVLNAISPAFTASFALADLIIEKIDLRLNDL